VGIGADVGPVFIDGIETVPPGAALGVVPVPVPVPEPEATVYAWTTPWLSEANPMVPSLLKAISPSMGAPNFFVQMVDKSEAFAWTSLPS
jgi:hypothetical protein